MATARHVLGYAALITMSFSTSSGTCAAAVRRAFTSHRSEA